MGYKKILLPKAGGFFYVADKELLNTINVNY